MLRALGAGVLLSWGLGRSSGRIAAQEVLAPVACVQDGDCVDADADPCTGAACLDGTCAFFVVDCIPGHVCCGNGTCCPAGETEGCLADTDCVPTSGDPCEGVRCEGGACVPFLVTCAPDFACCGNGTCCPSDGGCVKWGRFGQRYCGGYGVGVDKSI